jgi:hypothetical protein
MLQALEAAEQTETAGSIQVYVCVHVCVSVCVCVCTYTHTHTDTHIKYVMYFF